MELHAFPLAGLPEIVPGDDLAELIADAAADLRDSDVVAVAHKVVSKAEGRIVDLDGIEAGPKARELGRRHAKDPRHVQVVLDESAELLRAERGVLICRTPHGFVCANAGVDASNAGRSDRLVLLPVDPDASARALRAGLREVTGAGPAVLITDSFGRAWRHGQSEVAIGCAGMTPLDDWRGRADADGAVLRATWIAVADQAAAAADLARGGKDARTPVVVLRGLERFVTPADGPGATAATRPAVEDLFR